MPTAILDLSLGVLVSAFLLGLVLGGPYIRLLRELRFGQNIRREGPTSHYTKQGTPTMGGVLVIAVVAGLWLLVLVLLPESQRDDFVPQTIVPIGTLVAVGALGAIDDYVNVAYGFGIRGRQKLVWQFFVAVVAAVYIQRHFAVTGVFVFLSVAFIAAARGFPWLVVFCAAMVGAILAFLWFNVHPAEIFMGDTGALSFGATLATVALTTGFVLLLPVFGIIFVAETVAVILQVGSFKLRGKRIFRMSPLHNHFELIGWPEEKVTIRFWLIGALAGVVAAILAFATPIS